MEQHAVPQPITSYEFRLVGDMTLKQFGKLAFGVILALIVYWINPTPGILKWGLITIFVALGVGMAFLPFQGRPLDTWILSFFKRIYSPTQYVWRMGGKLDIKPSYEQAVDTNNQPITPVISGQSSTVSNQKSTNNQSGQIHLKQEATNNKQFDYLLSSVANETSPEPKITPRFVTTDSEPWHEGKPNQPVSPTPTETKIEDATDTLYQSPLPRRSFSEGGQIPKKPKPSVEKVTVDKNTIYSANSLSSSADHRSPITDHHRTVPPIFNPALIIPTLPNLPNIFGGFVKDTDGKLVEGAIIEVRDSALNPVRAFKTNKLGQFQIATPLSDGTYEIETEKDGLNFDIIKIEIKGEIIPPFEIVAKGMTVDS